MRSPPISDLQNDPIVEKLVDFAKKKKSVSFEEVTEFLPDSIVNSDRIDEIAAILEKNGVKLQTGFSHRRHSEKTGRYHVCKPANRGRA